MLKIRRSRDRLIINMRIPIHGKDGLHIETEPWCCWHSLTHWGRVTHKCVCNLTIIGPDNGLSPGRRQAIIWTNDGILLIGPLGTKFSEILIGIQTFSFKKIHLKMLSAKWRPFCLGLNVFKVMVCRLVDAKLLPESIPADFHLGQQDKNFGDIWIQIHIFLLWKCHLQNDGHFVLASMTTASEASDENFVNTTFPFQWNLLPFA